MNCAPSFFLSCKMKIVEVSYNNPYEYKISQKTDYRFITSS